MALTRPITIPARSVTTSERRRAISAAASDEMTRKVSVAASSPTRLDRSRPAAPASAPETSQVVASTRRTGTPNAAVISRSLASARIAVPRPVSRRNAAVARVMSTPSASAMIWVQLISTSPTEYRQLVVGSTIERALSLQIHDIAPSSISASPIVAAALTNGSRPARGGPANMP